MKQKERKKRGREEEEEKRERERRCKERPMRVILKFKWIRAIHLLKENR